MKSFVRQNRKNILRLAVALALFCFSIYGCSKDSSPSGPYDSPSYPNMIGHWTGTGSWWDSYNINVAWTADFTQQSDSVFGGTMTNVYTAPASMPGYSLTYFIKGSVTMAGRVTIAETSRAIVKWPISTMYLPALKTYSPCFVSTNRDTLSHSGPGPQPSATPETFVLVRQK
jgi:hypothetical protein